MIIFQSFIWSKINLAGRGPKTKSQETQIHSCSNSIEKKNLNRFKKYKKYNMKVRYLGSARGVKVMD